MFATVTRQPEAKRSVGRPADALLCFKAPCGWTRGCMDGTHVYKKRTTIR